jgi:formylglycine-generating enzyme required for sulfatase activity/mono/diheme cytochrome c family protein
MGREFLLLTVSQALLNSAQQRMKKYCIGFWFCVLLSSTLNAQDSGAVRKQALEDSKKALEEINKLLAPPKATPPNAQPVNDPGRALLKKHCVVCHSGGNAADDLDFSSERKLVEYLKSDESRADIWGVVEDGDMPPRKAKGSYEQKYGVTKEKLAAIQLDAGKRAQLIQWFRTYKPLQQQREFLSNAKLLDAILADIKALPEAERKYQRYLSLTNLYNAGDSDDDLEIYRKGITKLLNSMTWYSKLQKFPVVFGTQGTVLRFDLRGMWMNRQQQWSAAIWDSLARHYPYFIPVPGSGINDFEDITGTIHYHLRADWFAFAISRPPFYHDLLSLPGSLKQLEDYLGVDVAGNIAKTLQGEGSFAVRAGTTDSGVSRNHRIIERHALPDKGWEGAYWLSYDFRPSEGRGSPRDVLERPLGPDVPGGFEHDGGEVIFNLPNGMQAYYLATSKGSRLDIAPTEIVQNKFRDDAKVLNGISCIECHASGMNGIKAEIRDYADKTIGFGQRKKLRAVSRLYPGQVEVDRHLANDTRVFSGALQQIDAHAGAEPVSRLVERFQERVYLRNAAAEMDRPLDKLNTLLEVLGTSPELKGLKAKLDANGIPRNDFILDFVALRRKLFDVDMEFIPLPEPGSGQVGLASGATPTHGKPFIVAGLVLEMLPIPAGEFLMGSPSSEPAREDEEILHKVTLTQGFWLGKYEVTQAQWERVMGTAPSQFKGATLPVETVTWDDAMQFCEKLTQMEKVAGRLPKGYIYTLPTEAQWEYACRAGTTTAYSFGDTITPRQASYDFHVEQTSSVGTYPANAWGLHDMHGNVWEWCSDWYGKYPSGSASDPVGPSVGSARVFRGGSWGIYGGYVRSACRGGNTPGRRNLNLGFRLSLQTEKKERSDP